MDLSKLTVKEILTKFADKTLTSVELVEFYLKKIEEKNKEYNVYLFVRNKEDLLTEAQRADEERAKGNPKPLLGVPYSLKDIFMAEGTPTTAGDLYLKDTVSEFNSTIYERLREAGAILIGKTNMDGWGFGSTTENSSYGVVRNPLDKERVAGGSTGGSAASVALDMCAFGIGGDTGGSVRNPASFCGIYGLKPTYGRISRFGSIAYASSLDTVGIHTNTAEDAKLVFEVLQGADGKDMTLDTYEFDREVKKKFAYSKDLMPEGIDEDIKRIYLETIETFESAGYEAVEVKFPGFEYCVPTYYITAMCEASTNLSRYQGTRYGEFYLKMLEAKLEKMPISWEELFTQARSSGFNREAKRRVFLGAFVSSEGYSDAYYKKAQEIRNTMLREVNAILDDVDFILSPTTPNIAPLIGESSSDPLKAYLEDVYTVTVNLVGIPSISFPAGESLKEKMPIGMQIMGPKGSDERLTEILGEVRSKK